MIRLAAFLLLILAGSTTANAAVMKGSLADDAFQWPTWDQWYRVISLRDYNTRIVVIGVAVLGAGAGLVGSFTLLRKRALMGDALSHASLPGIAIAFIIATQLGFDGKSLSVLHVGATLSGLLGMAAILWIRNKTRLKEDAALGIVLSVFFGLGAALLGVIQQMESGSAAGLEGFIYGKTASMTSADVQLIVFASALSMGICLLLLKELQLLCFDEDYAGSRGFPIVLLDIGLMSAVVLITIVGLQAVGLILMIALLVIPAAAARFWTDVLFRMMIYSILLGVLGSMIGAIMSAVFPKLPSGAMIVLVCSAFFFASMFLGTSRGILVRWLRRRRLHHRVQRQHLLRAIYEMIEPEKRDHAIDTKSSVTLDELLTKRSWGRNSLQSTIRSAEHDALVRTRDNQTRLTRSGFVEAARLTRQHRMWEMYLITYAEIASAKVDRDADAIEHVLEPEVIDQLEDLLEAQKMLIPVPDSPHVLDSTGGA